MGTQSIVGVVVHQQLQQWSDITDLIPMCVCLCVSGDRSGAVSRLPRVHKAGSKRQSQSFCGQLQLLRDNWTRFSFGSGTSRHRHLLHLAPQERTFLPVFLSHSSPLFRHHPVTRFVAHGCILHIRYTDWDISVFSFNTSTNPVSKEHQKKAVSMCS